jgi:hypothetical protein
MIRFPTTKEIQEISERRYQKNILSKDGLKDPVGESKRHAYVCTGFEDWVRKMGVRHCDFIEDHIDYDADVITQGFKIEVKTKNILSKKVRGFYSQQLGPDWSILIPVRNYDQKPNRWVFGGCYDNYKIIELFGWLTEEEYKEVRGKSTPPGTKKNKLITEEWNYDINFIKMHPMMEFINFFLGRKIKQKEETLLYFTL